jgi:hypothetical protein
MLTQAIGGYNFVYTLLHFGLSAPQARFPVQPGEKSYNQPTCWFLISIIHFLKDLSPSSHCPTGPLRDCCI